jgi:hypothetical protein
MSRQSQIGHFVFVTINRKWDGRLEVIIRPTDLPVKVLNISSMSRADLSTNISMQMRKCEDFS